MVSIIVPVFNEAATLRTLLDRLETLEFAKEILLVDDGSRDGSTGIVREYEGREPYRVFLHEANRGKGACVRRGVREARGDVILFQDADLEYCPEELPGLIRPILEDEADVVYGARFTRWPDSIQESLHQLGNRMLTTFSNLMSGLAVNDMETCYKVFRADIIKSISITCDRFGSEPEITAKIARIPGIRLRQMPISYYPRWYDEGKKIGAMDGVLAVWYIVKFNLFHGKP